MEKTPPTRDHLLSVSGLLLEDKVLQNSSEEAKNKLDENIVHNVTKTSTSSSISPQPTNEVTSEQLSSLITKESLSNATSANAGSHVLFASDEWFATADNLLLDCPPQFVPDLYCPQGKVMDGWETRRKRVAGHDWAVIKLASKVGEVYAVEFDTAHFTGNHAPRVSVEVANIVSESDDSNHTNSLEQDKWMPGATARLVAGGGIQGTGRTPDEVDEAEAACRSAATWTMILPQTPLRPGYEGSSIHRFVLSDETRARAGPATHVRINYYPDGGVARLKIWGKPEQTAQSSSSSAFGNKNIIATSSNNSAINLPRPISATSVMNHSVYTSQADGKEATTTSSPHPPAPLDITSNWVAHSAAPYPHPELSSAELGGAGLACSNKHYGVPSNLIQSTYGKDMGDGWETARHPERPAIWAKDPKTGLMDSPLQDWAILKLGKPANLGVSRIILDTKHFRGNFPESVKVEGCCAASNSEDDVAVCEATPDKEPGSSGVEWFTLLPRTRMGADAEHVFERTDGNITNGDRPVTHVRVSIYPDGGLSRVRVYGEDVDDRSPSPSIQSHL